MDGLEETGIQLVVFTDLVSVEICISLYSRHQFGPCQKRTGHDSVLNLAIQIDPKSISVYAFDKNELLGCINLSVL